MSYTSWHTYGYGVCLSRLECDSMERMEKLLERSEERRVGKECDR